MLVVEKIDNYISAFLFFPFSNRTPDFLRKWRNK